MNSELVLKFMSQDVPWTFGLRAAIPAAPPVNDCQTPPPSEMPFFASVGEDGNRFTAIGEDLEECLEVCLRLPPAVPAKAEMTFVKLGGDKADEAHHHPSAGIIQPLPKE